MKPYNCEYAVGSVMVTAVGNEHCDSSPNSFTKQSTLGKGMNPTILPKVICK